ncbi:MAG: integrase family protein [Holophaga sp.]|jgi:integrase
MRFTQEEIEKIEPQPVRKNYSDPKTAGLVLRVTPNGAKSWWFVYRMGGRSSPKRWLKFGEFDALPLNRAQKQARIYRAQVDTGVDPAKKIKEETTEGETVASLARKYRVEVMPKLGASTQGSYGSALDIYILPKLGRFPVRELTTNQVQVWHDAISFPIAANRALATLSAMMTLAVEVWGMRPDGLNPCTRVERNPEPPRARDVRMEELRAVGKILGEMEAEGSHSLWMFAAIRVAALCWGRVSEVLGLRRDRGTYLEDGYATIKEHKGKKKAGDKRLEIPPPAAAILRKLSQDGNNPYYFPGRVRNRPISRDGLYKVWAEVCIRAGVEDLNIHDFRSLAASEAEAQGLGPKTGAAILGHKDIRTTLKHYTRARKTREAAAKVAEPIARALYGKVSGEEDFDSADRSTTITAKRTKRRS